MPGPGVPFFFKYTYIATPTMTKTRRAPITILESIIYSLYFVSKFTESGGPRSGSEGVARAEFQQETDDQQNETDFHGSVDVGPGFILNQFINVLISRKMVRKYETIIERTYPGNTLYHRNILGTS